MHRSRIDPLSLGLVIFAFAATWIGAACAGNVEPNTADDCQTGAYRFQDGEIIDIARSEGNTFRWRKFDGTTGALHSKPNGLWISTLGWTDRADVHTVLFARCPTGEIEFDS